MVTKYGVLLQTPLNSEELHIVLEAASIALRKHNIFNEIAEEIDLVDEELMDIETKLNSYLNKKLTK